MIRPSSLLMLATLFGPALPLAIQAQAVIAGLEKTEKGFKHAASGTEFLMPDKAVAQNPRPLPNNGVSVNLSWFKPVVTVTLYWIPLETKTLHDMVRIKPEGANNSYGQEHDNLKAFYGADKVGKPVQLKVGERIVYKIPVATGFDKSDSTVGALYLWEAGPNAKDRWRIRMRASYPKQDEAEHAKKVEATLWHFK